MGEGKPVVNMRRVAKYIDDDVEAYDTTELMPKKNNTFENECTRDRSMEFAAESRILSQPLPPGISPMA